MAFVSSFERTAVLAEPDPLATKRVIPRSHPWRWGIAAVLLILLVELIHNAAVNKVYMWGAFAHWFTKGVVLDGIKVTMEVTALSGVIGLALGVVLAAFRLSGNPILSTVSWLFVWVFRSLPLIVVLIIVYNFTYFYPHLGLEIPFGPTLGHVTTSNFFTPMIAGVVGLSLNEAAFASELVRGAILGIDPGQTEASVALGLSPMRQFTRVVLPQALRAFVPGFANDVIGLIKSSSLVYYVSLTDLFAVVQELKSTYPGDVVPLLMVGTVWYLIFSAVLSPIQYYIERHFARGAVRSLPPTPFQRLRSAVGGVRVRVREAREAKAVAAR